MNSRERIRRALNHKSTDILPVNFGTSATGMHVSIIHKLRQHYGLDSGKTPIKIIDVYQLLGEIKDDLKTIIGSDISVVETNGTIFGFNYDNWKEWELFDGTPVLVPGGFNTEYSEDGRLYQYPNGNKSLKPSAMMPKRGYFFNAIIRKKNSLNEELDYHDNLKEFEQLPEEELIRLRDIVNNLSTNTEYSIMGGKLAKASLGDVALIPGPELINPKGIRDIEEWYMAMALKKNYIKKIFEKQSEIAIETYKNIFSYIGNNIDCVYVTATDFGNQNGLFYSRETYKELYKPFHMKINDWIHKNTKWKSFIHSCGSIFKLIPDFVEAGFDVLNPIQISAKDMDPKRLKKEYGNDIIFCGGGIDTQKTLSFGKPEEIKDEAKRLIDIFSKDGGYIFSPVHNIQANVPIENVISLIEVIKECR